MAADKEIQILITAIDEVTDTMKNIEKKLDASNASIQKQTEKTTEVFQEQTANILILGQAANSVDRIFSSYQNMQYRVENATERVDGASANLSDAQNNLNKIMKAGTASAKEVADAQKKVESATRTLTIAQNRLSVTQNQIIGTYIGMGMQGITLIASFKKVKTALIEVTIASYKFIATPLGAALAALGAVIAITTGAIRKQRQEEEDLLAATNALADGKANLTYLENQYAKQIEDINVKADKELLSVQNDLKSKGKELVSINKDLVQNQADLTNKTKELKTAEAELAIIQAGIADETDNWADALENVDKYMKRFIVPQTEAEAQSLVDLQDQEHAVNVAKLSGDEAVIQSEEDKLARMKLIHQANFDDVRDKALAELNLLEVKTATEKGLMQETQTLYQSGYDNITTYLQSVYYPKLQEMWQASNEAELKAQQDKIDEIIKINDEINEINQRAIELELLKNEVLQETIDLNKQLAEVQVNKEAEVKAVTEEYNTQKTIIEEENKKIETTLTSPEQKMREAQANTTFLQTIYSTNNPQQKQIRENLAIAKEKTGMYALPEEEAQAAQQAQGGITSTISNVLDSIGDFLAGIFTSKKNKVPAYEKGGYVPNTGIALLHAGEYVVPKIELPTYQKGGYVSDTEVALLHKGEYVVPESEVNSSKQSSLTIIIEGDNYGIDAEQIAQSLANKFNNQIRI